MKNVRSNQASISVNSCTELGKTQFFPMSTVNKDWIANICSIWWMTVNLGF